MVTSHVTLVHLQVNVPEPVAMGDERGHVLMALCTYLQGAIAAFLDKYYFCVTLELSKVA
jgi:hypothetical protein